MQHRLPCAPGRPQAVPRLPSLPPATAPPPRPPRRPGRPRLRRRCLHGRRGRPPLPRSPQEEHAACEMRMWGARTVQRQRPRCRSHIFVTTPRPASSMVAVVALLPLARPRKSMRLARCGCRVREPCSGSTRWVSVTHLCHDPQTCIPCIIPSLSTADARARSKHPSRRGTGVVSRGCPIRGS